MATTFTPFAPDHRQKRTYGAFVQYGNTHSEADGRGMLDYWIVWHITYEDLDSADGSEDIILSGIPGNARVLDFHVDTVEGFTATGGGAVALASTSIEGDTTTAINFLAAVDIDTKGLYFYDVDAQTLPVKSETPATVTATITHTAAQPWATGDMYVMCKVIGFHDA